ncbi:uncharacterized protein KIAA2026 [Solea solea]|uniref:uncharacterized protein KIAA2026 n=1 Tax=Solea solea TaxID=90069 RepID=UPI00272CCBA8|nr:uncharacterized protein KIAA2026 [Solea solea]
MDQEDMSEQIPTACTQPLLFNQDLLVLHQSPVPQLSSDLEMPEDLMSNGTCETVTALYCPGGSGDVPAEGNHLAVGNDNMSEFSNSDLSLPEVCISTNSNSCDEDDMNHEVQQAYRIFTGFLLEKHKGITQPFLLPIGHQEAQHGIGGAAGWGQAQLRQSMCLRRMEEKFINQEYETLTEFVADFRLMLENCYRYHGVDHWISKQAQKLEIMLEQKLTLLSRTLRAKTTLAMTSKGRFGAEEDRGSGGTSTRRRLAIRSLATLTVGGHESIMVQTLRLEEQQRAKEERRQREVERKEAEEMSAKEVEEWEQTLRSQASPHTVDALWELPAIGHFLCLAQNALNLPEIVFFELERCLLMPRCSLLLSKIMSSLLSPPQRRATLNRRPPLPYRRWESELRQRVMVWYRCVGASYDQPGRAEQLGLCHQFFSTIGDVSPLEEKPFHLLPFYQRVWLLKGLCDHVYETQKCVQDAVLAQPIHECRESILGYDSKENAYIHFPHFCGADLRIYRQSPSAPPAFPFPSVLVKRVEMEPGTEGDESDGMKADRNKSDSECYGGSMDKGDFQGFGKGRAETLSIFKRENGDEEEDKVFKLWSLKKEKPSESGSSDRDSSEESKIDLKINTNSIAFSHTTTGRGGGKVTFKEETVNLEHESKRFMVKQEQELSFPFIQTVIAETQDPCLSVGEHSYTGRSPARSVNLAPPSKQLELKMEGESPSQRASCLECCKSNMSNAKFEGHNCFCGTSGLAAQMSSESTQNSSEERTSDIIWTKKKKRKKMRGREQLPRVKGKHKPLQHVDRMRLSPAEAAKSAGQRVATMVKRKDRKKRHKTEKKLDSSMITDEPEDEPPFELVCTSLEELRELISKTEDELDDLESAKKRLGRWYYRREAVKDLHSTLIRLLNELSPWEPKLVKAYQRNRLRLKKEFDDFKEHPEYNNFVREECISSSSSSDEDEDEERGLGKDMFTSTDHYRKSEEEDMEHLVPRGLWSGASTREFGADSAGETIANYVSPIHLKHSLATTEKAISLRPRAQIGSRNITSVVDSGPQSRSELTSSNPSMDSNSAWAADLPVQTPLSPRLTILHPTIGLPKGYTPIPTLLAKSVGNKVTLMKRPADCAGYNNLDGQSKGSLVSPPTSAMVATKHSTAQTSSFSSQKNSQMQAQGQQTQLHRQPGMATVTAAPLKSPQAKLKQTVPKSPVQVVCNVPQGLGQHTGKDSSSPVKLSVLPVMNHNTGEKVMQQVVILTSNILSHKTEEKESSFQQQQSEDIHVPVSKVASPLCMSTNVPGFTIPENRIPVQQVAPLKDARTVNTPSPSVSTYEQQGTLNTAGFKGAQICSVQTSTPQGVVPILSLVTSPSSAVSTESVKMTDPKQELQTVCIRDSQSILVTTRGGNTGIVKVQTSSDHGVLGSLPTSPVITISPQFKAFLLSKTSAPFPPFAPSQTTPCTFPVATSLSVAQPQMQVPSVLNSLPTLTTPLHNAVTSSIPITGPGSQAAGNTFVLSQGSNTSTCSTVTKKIGQLVQATAAGSPYQASVVKNAVIPSPKITGVLTQSKVTKTGVKRVSTDEGSQVTKVILATPSSSSTSSVAMLKGTVSSQKSLPSSRVVFISQPTATSSSTFLGNIPKQAIAAGASGQLLTTSLSDQTLKMGISPDQSIDSGKSEALAKVRNISLPSGVLIHLSGKTTTIGQKIGALSCSPSKNTTVSLPDAGSSAATRAGLVQVSNSNTITTCSAQLASHTSLTTRSSQCTPSFTMISQTVAPTITSTATNLPTGNLIKTHLGICGSESFSSPPAQVTTTGQSNLAQSSTLTHVSQKSNNQSGIVSSSSQFALNTSISLGTTTSAPFTTSATGTVQNRMVINTSTPLAAGTQIILNNTRFVVPPQGLGPGSHVLIISSPAPQQVPTANATRTGASVPLQGASHAVVAPQAPVLSQSPAKLSGVPAASSPVVACTPAVGSSFLATTPSMTPVQPPGTPGHGSTLLPRKTLLTTLPRFATAQAHHFASPSGGSPKLGCVPALLSPVVTSVPAFGSGQVPIRLAATTFRQTDGPSTILPAGTNPLPRVPAPLPSLPVLPSPATVSLSSPVIPIPPPLCSAAAPLVAGTPLHRSINQHIVSLSAPGQGIKPQQTAAPSVALSQVLLHTVQSITLVRKHVPSVMQPVLPGTRTQVLPTVAVPPTVSVVSRMQTLPVATVPPIGSTVNTFETALVGTTSQSGSAVIITPAQPISSLKTNNIHPPIVPTSQTLEKHTLQTPSFGIHTNVASKLLISPDGAVLSTAQCHVNPSELTGCSKPLVSSNSSRGALHTHDSSLQPSQANTK